MQPGQSLTGIPWIGHRASRRPRAWYFAQNSCKDPSVAATNPCMQPPPANAVLFQQWLEEHQGIVVKVTRSFAFTAADAADLRQELLLQLWLSLPAYAGQAKVSTWIYRVCLNTALTWRRGNTRRERRLETTDDLSPFAADTPSPAEHAGDREVVDRLYAGIKALPAADRALVVLSLEGLSYRDMSDVTGLSENHVGVALTRARQRLAGLLKETTDELE